MYSKVYTKLYKKIKNISQSHRPVHLCDALALKQFFGLETQVTQNSDNLRIFNHPSIRVHGAGGDA